MYLAVIFSSPREKQRRTFVCTANQKLQAFHILVRIVHGWFRENLGQSKSSTAKFRVKRWFVAILRKLNLKIYDSSQRKKKFTLVTSKY